MTTSGKFLQPQFGFVLAAFLFSTSLFSQSVSHQYTQFLNTSKWDFGSRYSGQFFYYDLGLTTAVQKLDKKQLRDELNFNFGLEQPLFDSLLVYGKLNTVSVFIDQNSKTRNLDWTGLVGGKYKTENTVTTLGAGEWLTELSSVQSAGRAFELEHNSEFPVFEILNSQLSADFFDGKADNRYVGKGNFQFSLTDPVSHIFSLQYQNYNLKRDYIASAENGEIKLNYRYESTNRLSGNLSYPLFDRVNFKYQVNLENRVIKRFSDIAAPTSPNTEIQSISSRNKIELATHFSDWFFAVESNITNDEEEYKATETNGLTDAVFEFQNAKIKQRNNNSTSFNLKPKVEYSDPDFSSSTSATVEVDRFYNPNNNGLDDRDIGIIGFFQNVKWQQNKNEFLSYSMEYQHLHQVFIDRSNSGDNFRNHFIRLSQDWQHQPLVSALNRMTISISSQIRTYDFDDRFPTAKSFTFRSFLIEDSLTFNLMGYRNFIKVRSSESIQGKFFQKIFSELPLKSFSLYSIEYGLLFFFQKLQTSFRLINQDQFSFSKNIPNLIQKIRQFGPVFKYGSQSDNHQLIADIWLQFQKTDNQKAEFQPSVQFSYELIF